jgi:hypothetical protein
VVAVPATWMGLAAVWSFSGCFITCSQPDPVVGTFWALSALVLLALPVVVGVFTARAISGKRGYISALVLTHICISAMRVSPGSRTFADRPRGTRSPEEPGQAQFP